MDQFELDRRLHEALRLSRELTLLSGRVSGLLLDTLWREVEYSPDERDDEEVRPTS